MRLPCGVIISPAPTVSPSRPPAAMPFIVDKRMLHFPPLSNAAHCICVHPYPASAFPSCIAGNHLNSLNLQRRFIHCVIGHAPAQQPRRIADKRAGRCFIRPHISARLANQDKVVAKCSNIIRKDQLFASYAAGYDERANLILRFVQADTLHQTDLPMIADDRKITQYADADQAVHLFPVSLLLSCPHP